MRDIDHNSEHGAPPPGAPRVRRRLSAAGVLRALLYCTVVSVAYTAFSLHRANCAVRESAKVVGRDLLRMADVLGPPQALVLNGATMLVGGRHVDLSVAEVLARFDTYCEEQSGHLEEELARLSDADPARVPVALQRPGRLAILRSEVEDEGVLACLAVSGGARGLAGWADRVSGFLATGDVARLGELRYVYVRKNEKAGGSNLVSVWQQGEFKVAEMFLGEGDVPGRDDELMPRPTGSIRVLSAEIAGTAYGVKAYELSGPIEIALDEYRDTVSKLGWHEAALSESPDRALRAASSRVFIRNGAVVFVAGEELAEHRALVQLVFMGTRGAAIASSTRPELDVGRTEAP